MPEDAGSAARPQKPCSRLLQFRAALHMVDVVGVDFLGIFSAEFPLVMSSPRMSLIANLSMTPLFPKPDALAAISNSLKGSRRPSLSGSWRSQHG